MIHLELSIFNPRSTFQGDMQLLDQLNMYSL